MHANYSSACMFTAMTILFIIAGIFRNLHAPWGVVSSLWPVARYGADDVTHEAFRPSTQQHKSLYVAATYKSIGGGLLRAGDSDRQLLRAPAPSGNGGAARRSAANAGSVVLTAAGRG